MNRIQVVGNSGSGKSTLSAKLAAVLGIPHIELDAHFHQPNWSRPEEFQFLSKVDLATRSDRWVVDGNYSSVRPILWKKFFGARTGKLGAPCFHINAKRIYFFGPFRISKNVAPYI